MKDKILLFLILLMVIAVGSFVWQFILTLPREQKIKAPQTLKKVPITIEKAPVPEREILPPEPKLPEPKTKMISPTLQQTKKIKEHKITQEKYVQPVKKEEDKERKKVIEEYHQRLWELEKKLSHIGEVNQQLTAQLEQLKQEAEKNLQLFVTAQSEKQKQQQLYNIAQRNYTAVLLRLEETEKNLSRMLDEVKDAANQHIKQTEKLLEEASKSILSDKLIYATQLLSQAKAAYEQQNYTGSLSLALRSQAEINALNLLSQQQKTQNRKNILAHTLNLLLFLTK